MLLRKVPLLYVTYAASMKNDLETRIFEQIRIQYAH